MIEKRKTERIFFKSTDGLSLSGEIHRPEGLPRGTIVLAHPHPQYGGTMENNVVDTLWRELAAEGWLTFRFNFRGVGASEGRFEEGIGETHDLKGAIRFLMDAGYNHLPCYLIGYSFGAYVIYLLDAVPDAVEGIVMISPPVSMSAFEAGRFKTLPTLFISGDRDLFCRPEALQKLAAALKTDKAVEIIPGIDHFWFGKENSLVAAIRAWIRSRLKADS